MMSQYADPAEPRRSAVPDALGRPRRTKAVRLPRRPAKRAARIRNLFFESTAVNVPLAMVEHSPTLLVAAVEDLVWRFDVQDWSKREPAKSDREAHAGWQSEARRFHDKSARIQEMVDEALMAS